MDLHALSRVAAAEPLSDELALRLADAGPAELEAMLDAATRARDAFFGRTATFSPKVFLPLTNVCRNRCDYCSFRRSPGDPGAWTMTHDEVVGQLRAGSEQSCTEALFCLGDKPEGAFAAYRRTLATLGHEGTVDYLVWASERALEHGLLPHTNAGVLSREDMTRLRACNASLGLMLESTSERLCEPGMPHHRAPDKRPAVRLRMLDEAGELRIPFTTGILIGIGETRRERVQSLLAIRALHRRHGHVQEVIVQNFTPRPDVPMAEVSEPDDVEMAHAVAMARLVLDPDVHLQSPPNLNPKRTALLLRAGIDDFGGISPVTPDYINPRHPWPHLDALGRACRAEGFALRPRLPVYPSYVAREGWLDARVRPYVDAARARHARFERLGEQPAGAADQEARP